eukprot:CAMPEP_0113319064 /NCGR_PEP_ID=MMETSP0010_2-20120614/13409_1 /TAXON_ID=216773 ORGANISM="Corethron hystrix, Strain 308" /NCGR_SAMPLE_ID=MMETSP0010_2 /ASSEMBLY_ACC=CAM_ASM_000155 /LENGTH=59 /DNA_ID=CAMNT_0000176545 /DNA_START=82 /DNA_END=258 /DNA_ORIENTATION=- /assembly_acc=CAM_ASM_000155
MLSPTLYPDARFTADDKGETTLNLLEGYGEEGAAVEGFAVVRGRGGGGIEPGVGPDGHR